MEPGSAMEFLMSSCYSRWIETTIALNTCAERNTVECSSTNLMFLGIAACCVPKGIN